MPLHLKDCLLVLCGASLKYLTGFQPEGPPSIMLFLSTRFYETQEIQGTCCSDFLRAREIYYWECSCPREYPTPTPQTCVTYLWLKNQSALWGHFFLGSLTEVRRLILVIWQTGPEVPRSGRGPHTVQTHRCVHHCKEHSLPFLLADPPLASEDWAPMPVTSDISNLQ